MMTAPAVGLRERLKRRVDHGEVDPAIYDGIDFDAAERTAAELREIEIERGEEAMLARVASVSVEDARRYGGSYRPQAG
jgi:hypothetical protein